MKISVCFQLVPDLDKMGEHDWVSTTDFEVDTTFISKNIDHYDESGLEMALRMREQAESSLQAITIGKNHSFLKQLYALKYDQVVRVESDMDLHFQSEMVAGLLASAISKEEAPDVVLIGSQSAVGSNGKTPYLLAEMLEYPCISQVHSVSVEGDVLRVESLCDDGMCTQVVQMPCVLIVGNAPSCYLRVPTLMDKMKTKNKEVVVYQQADLTCDISEKLEVVSLTHRQSNRTTEMISGDTMAEKVAILRQKKIKGLLL